MLSSLSVLLVVSTVVVNAVNLDLNRVTAEHSAQTGVAHYDRARASSLRTRDSSDASNIPVTQFGYVWYTVSVGVGDPPTYYDLIADTGSSNTWVGAGKPYVPTSTSIRTNETVEVTYGTGYFVGDEYYDQVTLSPDFVVHNQSIGGAYNFSSDFAGSDGIFGIGPVDLTVDTLSPDNSTLIPTVLDNALAQGIVQQEVIGVSFVPATTANDTDGVITFGSLDTSLYIGEIQYVPTTETSPAATYWGINITYATIGREPLIPGSFAGIVDTGTTGILLADDWFQTYLDTIPGAYVDVNSTGFLIIPKSSVHHLQAIDFVMGNSLFTFTPAAQLIPQFQNKALGGDPSVQYGVVGPLGTLSGAGFDFVLGQKFMERYYAVFDGANQRVGFGFTKYTFSQMES